MQTGRNVDSTPAHWACGTVQFLKKATPFTLDQIWNHQRAQTCLVYHKIWGGIQQRVY